MPKKKEPTCTDIQVAALLQAIVTLKDDKNLPNEGNVFPDDLSWRQANKIRRGDLTSLRDFTRTILQDDATIQLTVGPGEVKAVLHWYDGEKGSKGHAYASPNVAGDMGIAALEAIFSSKIQELQAATPKRQETRSIQEIVQDITLNDDGIAPVAYIGVNGERLRVLVPVERIELESSKPQPTATASLKARTWTEVDHYLEERAKRGDHDSFSFLVVWANGHFEGGNIILPEGARKPSLADHIRSQIKDPEDKRLSILDLEQLGPVPAPDDWTVAWDYREGRCRDLEQRVYSAIAVQAPRNGLST
jgi:hypothetical protein